jgi:hypothetical protein
MCGPCRDALLREVLAAVETMTRTLGDMEGPVRTRAVTDLLLRVADLLPQGTPRKNPKTESTLEGLANPAALAQLKAAVGPDQPGEKVRRAVALLDALLPEASSERDRSALLKLRAKAFSVLAKQDREEAARPPDKGSPDEKRGTRQLSLL